MIEVSLKVRPNVVRETLNRIGVKIRPQEGCGFPKALAPSVYLYHTKVGNDTKFFLIHFKEWFLLNVRDAYDNVSQDDRQRLAYVAKLLREWELIDCDPTLTVDELLGSPLTIVKKADVQQWFIAHKIKF